MKKYLITLDPSNTTRIRFNDRRWLNWYVGNMDKKKYPFVKSLWNIDWKDLADRMTQAGYPPLGK